MNSMMMLTVLATLCLSGLVSGQTQNWPHLRTTYGVPGLSGFNPQPRTVEEATDEGWIRIGECGDSLQFAGERYAMSLTSYDMILIFDVNGYIAGIQTMVPTSAIDDESYYSYSEVPYFTAGDFLGEEGYFLTVYFLDPALICTVGRTEQEFESDGTGTYIAIQNGPLSTSVEYPPITMEEAQENSQWNEHYCFVNMGYHFFTLQTDGSDTCNDLTPYQLVYYYGELNGFVFQTVAPVPSENFEEVTEAALNAIVNTPPQCLVDMTSTPGVSTMHVYMDTYIVTCLQEDQEKYQAMSKEDRPRMP